MYVPDWRLEWNLRVSGLFCAAVGQGRNMNQKQGIVVISKAAAARRVTRRLSWLRLCKTCRTAGLEFDGEYSGGDGQLRGYIGVR
jgi:hypothetical protein